MDIHKECRVRGNEKFDDGLYAIQEIFPDFEEYLGFIGYAVPANRTAETRTSAQNKL